MSSEMITTARHFLLSGGGTLGSVMPLLALVEQARNEGRPWRFTWIGTASGPEKNEVERYAIPFYCIINGKWRRYFSWRNLLTPLFVLLAFIQSFMVLARLRPDVVITAGGFVGVPLAWAAWCYRLPVVVHEQDVQRGLASRLVAPFATLRTVIWPGDSGTVAVGNLIRPSVYRGDTTSLRRRWPESAGLPILLALGGGTGAIGLNNLIAAAAPALTVHAFIVHITGYGKEVVVALPRYVQLPFLADDFADIFTAADLVITRAGMGTLSELATLRKAIIAVPMPNSHQERNAAALSVAGAAVVLNQSSLTAISLAATVADLLADTNRRQVLGEALYRLIPDGTAKFIQRVALI